MYNYFFKAIVLLIVNFFSIILLARANHLDAFPPPVTGPKYCSPIALKASPDRQFLYVADQTGGRVIKFNIKTSQVQNTWQIAEEAQGLTVSPDGKTIYVACDRHEGKIKIINSETGEILKTIKVGHTPMAPVIHPTKAELYVVNRFSNTLSIIDLEKQLVVNTLKLPREPVAMAISNNGETLVIANLLPRGPASVEYKAESLRLDAEKYQKVIHLLENIETDDEDLPQLLRDDDKNEEMLAIFKTRLQDLTKQIHDITNIVVSCEVSLVKTEGIRQQNHQVTNLKLPNGVINMRDVCISPDDAFAYVTHQVARYQAPTSQVTRGWINTNGITIINLKTNEQHTVLLDDLTIGAANPWDLACSEDGKKLFVTHSALHDFSMIDREAMHQKIDNYRGHDILMDLMFMRGIRERIQIPSRWPDANGGRSVTVVGDKVYLGLFFDESIAEFSWKDAKAPRLKVFELTPRHELTSERKGEIYFCDAEVCLQKWQSCISCHPDARADGLNWDLLNDGIGNAKQGKSMLFSHVTTPCMVTGIRPNAEVAVRAGVKYIQFGSRPENEYNDIDNYLKSLRPEQSPYLVKGELSEKAKKGRRHFENYGCASCHRGPYFTDHKVHPVGTGIGREAGRAFDTPTLIELWRTAPYLYDGRTDNMEDLILHHNSSGVRGHTSKMTHQEASELAEYILSL